MPPYPQDEYVAASEEATRFRKPMLLKLGSTDLYFQNLLILVSKVDRRDYLLKIKLNHKESEYWN